MARWYWYDKNGTQVVAPQHPDRSRPIPAAIHWLQPELISDLHESFARWLRAKISPGTLTPDRLWIDQNGRLAVRFSSGSPAPLSVVGSYRELAQWLVLLDKWMDTHVVLARARAVWSVAEMAGALSFTTPSLLPRPLVQMPPDNWEQVARGLAAAVLDGPLAGGQ